MLRDIRKNYRHDFLDESKLTGHPLQLFQRWLDEAIQHEEEPTAMTLSTVVDGQPDSRIVLLKQADEAGLVFFTNYHSHKGAQLEQNNQVAVNFFWPRLERQVRVKGRVEKLPDSRSAEYFKSRPRDSQLGAWASPQSREISSREELDERFAQFDKHFENLEIEKPPHWGGYLVKPAVVEFWQGRPNRLHDRFCYKLEAKQWTVQRLAP
ncbi:pyridoxamine 5'-phosphate oxidase [Mangrovibacterium marinum]|uniref:Pyridoxine/pyridoxamine 5'-phosphate oxidase n=1 Tax=Mangrovibacterium marinum TaxID=1639118 RepID=A0A2T5C392_9BACT|nr:pyridoxamine 5'-phosphate oxidase [Mangrovibacterium marinum]PTN09224.1 pyridoxamine 5'-phosphate oxidase [Mangrovibacterium marinum]